jgi:hypothetical protein
VPVRFPSEEDPGDAGHHIEGRDVFRIDGSDPSPAARAIVAGLAR